MSRKHSSSEVHAYRYILDELINKKEWGKEQVFTQQECLTVPALAQALHSSKPENVVKINETTFYIIEAKNERVKISLALKEAREDYASPVNQQNKVKVPFVTGIAGNSEEGFTARSQYFKDGKWETIKENDVEVTGLLSKNQIEKILLTNDPSLKEITYNEREFLKVADEINGILHEGGVHKDERAKVMSAILLALYVGTAIDLNEEPSLLIDAINSRVQLTLKKHNKSDFARFLSIDMPSSTDNHFRLKKAIVATIQKLEGLNIRSAMKSGNDILGTFYEVFLKYGNGAKELGIVLTPRHIAKFAAAVLDIQPNDLVLDPTCGTGGFLVAAFDEVKQKATESEWDNFKRWGLYGIDEQDRIMSLALVNMIFRGDGKNNIISGNCFAQWLTARGRNGTVHAEYLSKESTNRIPPITKVLMNPPFPKKKTDTKEFRFIEQALKQMQDEGLLFAVLPYSCMIKGGEYAAWRKRLLLSHTLLSVITFPEDLFYPVGVHTLGLIVKKGVPHAPNQKVLWLRAVNDGRLKKKGKRLENPRARNDLAGMLDTLKRFVNEQDVNVVPIPALQKASVIDVLDKDLELVPEAYLDEMLPTPEQIDESIEQLMRDNIAFRIQFEKQLNEAEHESVI